MLTATSSSQHTGRTYARLLSGALSGFLLISTLFLPWSADGVGSTIPGRRLADLLLRQEPRSTAELLGGTALYVVALVGAVVIAISAIAGKAVFAIRMMLVGSTAASAGVACIWSGWTPPHWGGASMCLVGGVIAGFVALATGFR